MSESSDRPILICDSANIFIRAWCAYPQLNVDGEPVGGCIGYLKTLQKIISEMQPSAVYICWEGGGSSKRRAIFKEYKMNRRPQKLNRFYEDDLPNNTEENKQKQMIVLLGLLKCLPVCQLYVSDCEGDDLIAFLCREVFRDKQKIIASSDKDMYQLLDDNTKIYNLHKKTYITTPDVLQEFRVTAKNFALAKCLCGDASDNIPGIKGVGYKTVSKLFPTLGTESDVFLQDILDYAYAHVGESRHYKTVIENFDDVRRNWRLIYLDGGMIPPQQQTSIRAHIEEHQPKVNRIKMVKLLAEQGINAFDVGNFCSVFNGIIGLQYTV